MADGYQALYRRYRSKRFADLRGQDHVVRALRAAVAEGRVGHAYLFSGPRGTGKTSTARILAKALNCEHPADGEPDGTCPNCLAVDEGRIVDWLLELDAASNNGVANIRELIERIPLGTSGNRKVVILDEVHMLSTGASNALLKSLEEPPAHVVFILCTTDPQKVLPTIRSRTQHFEFHLLEAEELADHVRYVIADAGLGLGEDAVDHVVRRGGGSARDTLSALDQVSAMGGVIAEAEPVDAVLDAIAAHDAGAALVAVAEATASGRDPRALGERLIERLRDAFLAQMGAPDRHLPAQDATRAAALGAALGNAGLTRSLEVLGDALVELAKKPDPRIVLEVALVRICRPETDRSLDALLERIERLEHQLAGGAAVTPTAAPSVPSPAPATAAADPGDAADARAATETSRPSGPAASAREELAKAQARTPRPPVKKATSPRATAAPRATAPAPADAPTPAAAPDEPAGPAAPAPAVDAAAGVPDAAALTAAWATVLEHLKGSARAMFLPGRFLPSTDRGAVLGLANQPTVDHCEKKRPEVEAALAAHFGRPVALSLVVDPDGGAAPPVSSSSPAGGSVADDEAIDVDELEDAPAAGTSIDRLTEAFPGAELVDEP